MFQNILKGIERYQKGIKLYGEVAFRNICRTLRYLLTPSQVKILSTDNNY